IYVDVDVRCIRRSVPGGRDVLPVVQDNGASGCATRRCGSKLIRDELHSRGAHHFEEPAATGTILVDDSPAAAGTAGGRIDPDRTGPPGGIRIAEMAAAVD